MVMQETQAPHIGDVRPIPDPTVLTQSLVLRETVWLRELIEARLDANDRALALLQSRADRVPSEMDIAIGNLKELHATRFDGIDRRFDDLADRTREVAATSKDSIDKALQSAREAVAAQQAASDRAISKSEASTAETLKQLTDQINTRTSALGDRISELKERVDKIQGQGTGQSGTIYMAFAAIAALAALVAIGVGLAALLS